MNKKYSLFDSKHYEYKTDKSGCRVYKDRAEEGKWFIIKDQRQSHTIIKDAPSGILYQFNRGHPSKVAETDDIAFFEKYPNRFLRRRNGETVKEEQSPDLEEDLKNKLVKSGFSDNTAGVVANEYGSIENFMASMLSGDNFVGVLFEEPFENDKEITKLINWCKKESGR